MEKVKSIHHTFSACTRPTWEFVKAAASYDFRWRSTFLEKIAAPTRQTCLQKLFAETRSGGWPRTVKNCTLLVHRGRSSREQWDPKEKRETETWKTAESRGERILRLEYSSEFDCASFTCRSRRKRSRWKEGGRWTARIRGNPCRTKFAIERSSRWRFMSCRDRLLVTP